MLDDKELLEAFCIELRRIGGSEDDVACFRRKADLNSHWVGWLKDHQRPDRELAALRSDRRRALLEAGAPELHLQHVFDAEPEASEAFKAVAEWFKGKLTFLLLVGGVGTGKSAATVLAMVREAQWRHAVTSRFVDARSLARFLRHDAADDLAQLEKCCLLVLDDLGAEFIDGKGWVLAGVDGLINIRYGSCARTIITSNLTVEQFRDLYGPRIADRLRESGKVVSIAGESRRRVSPQPMELPLGTGAKPR